MKQLYTVVCGRIGTNCYILTDENKDAVIFDVPDSSGEKIAKFCEEEQLKPLAVLLTHGHFDHILWVEKFKEVFGIDAYVSEDDIPQVKATPDMIQMFTGLKVPQITGIDKFVKDGDEFTIGNTKIKALTTPGHTEGGMCYLVEDKLFSGDTLFQRSVGRTDFPGGSFEKLSKSIKEKLFLLPEDIEVYPGHGPKTSIGFEKKYNEIL